MGTSEELMQRLAVSKKIMEKTEGIQRGSVDSRHMNTPVVEDYQAVPATYNLPQEFLPESNTQRHTHDPSQPIDMNRIKSSKLPDEIKRLMIEQPIVQPSSSTSNVISDEIIEGAQRLMNMNSTNKVAEQPKSRTLSENVSQPQNNTGNFNMNEMKSMIRDVVRDTVRDVVREELKDAGMIVESTSDSNEIIQFKVGKHLFVGKVTKVKKMQ